MSSYKNRMIDRSKPVRVYRNLHRDCFSIQQRAYHLEGCGGVNRKGQWYVVAHVTELTLADVTFEVSETGRQRVIQEQRKNVHAYVHGTVVCVGTPQRATAYSNNESSDYWDISYDPYSDREFKFTPLREGRPSQSSNPWAAVRLWIDESNHAQMVGCTNGGER